jgi:uncharacterized protein (DUF1330 family)
LAGGDGTHASIQQGVVRGCVSGVGGGGRRHGGRAQPSGPAFVIVERTATTGDKSIQQDYAKLARDILPKYGGRYLARSQHNALLEGDGGAPCCMAILEFPSLEAVHRWFDSPENQSATKVRQSGAKFRIIAIEGLPEQK